jgi:bifunctional non-homologous end joining protein LigD
MPLPKASSSGFVPPCIPTRAAKPPVGADWVHEIKHDGYRLQVRREGDTVRLFTRRGYDWTARYPAIAGVAAQLRAKSFTLDGEAVVCGPGGVAIFDALHRRGTVSEAMLYVFDLLELDGEDLRGLPLGDRKKRLARLLARRRVGIVLSAHTDEDGAAIFQQACKMGLEGIVSKRLSAPYRSGPSRDWIKVKNPESPAMIRAREAVWQIVLIDVCFRRCHGGQLTRYKRRTNDPLPTSLDVIRSPASSAGIGWR